MKLIASSNPKQWVLVCVALFLLLIGNNLIGVDTLSPTGGPFTDEDYDQDGLSNAIEAEIGTYPWNAYSDGDLLKDGEDAVPLNGAMKVLAAPETNYAIVDLGESATVGVARGLNDSGEVLLARGIPEEIVLWSAGTFITVRGAVPWTPQAVWGPLQDGSVYYNSQADAGGASPLVRWTKSGTSTVGIADDSPGFNWGESYGTWTGPAGTAVVQGPAATALAAGASSLEAYVAGHIGEENLQSKSASGHILRMNDAHMKMVHATMSRGGNMYYTENDWNHSYQAGGTAHMQGWIHDTALQSETAYVNWTGQAMGGRFPVDGTDPEQYEELLNESVGIPGVSTGAGGVVGRVMVNIDNFGIYDVKGASETQGVAVVNGLHTNIPRCAQVFDLNVSTTEEGPYFLGNHTASNPSLYGNATTLWCYNSGSFSSIELKGLAYNWGVVVGRMISNRLVIPMNYVIWRNSRIRSLHELCGNPSEWSPIVASHISPNGLMLAQSQKIKDSQGNDIPLNQRKFHTLLLLPIEVTWESVGENNNISDNKTPVATNLYSKKISTNTWMPAKGKRIFPDQRTPSDTIARNKAKLKVKIPGITGWTVYVKAFDVDDPIPDAFDRNENDERVVDPTDQGGEKGDDNRDDPQENPKVGKFTSSSTNTASAQLNAQSEAEFEFQVGMQPGNNYRVAVAVLHQTDLNVLQVSNKAAKGYVPAISDEPAKGFYGALSPTLTVWRTLHIEQDSMEQIPVTGDEKNFETGVIDTVTSLGSNRYSLNLSVQLSGPNNRFENGRLYVNGWLFKVISSNHDLLFDDDIEVEDDSGGHLAAMHVASNLVGQNFIIFDDDDTLLPPSLMPPLPKFDLITDRVKGLYIPAYINVEEASAILNTRPSLPFKRNLADGYDFDFLSSKKDVEDSVGYWAHLIVSAYQPWETESCDPNTDAALLGITEDTRILNIGINRPRVSVVYLEMIRELRQGNLLVSDALKEKMLREVFDAVTAHEIGHVPSQKSGPEDHDEGGLMKAGASDLQVPFNAITIDRFRDASRWSGGVE